MSEKPIEIGALEELEELLLQKWPRGSVTRAELFEGLGITMPLERNIIIGQLGVWDERWAVADVARLFWERSNYADEDDGPGWGAPAQPRQPAPPWGRAGGPPTHQARGGVRHQAGALARPHPDAERRLTQLSALAERMADLLEGVLQEVRRAEGSQAAGADIASALDDWRAWSRT